jgi:hypothetical protein
VESEGLQNQVDNSAEAKQKSAKGVGMVTMMGHILALFRGKNGKGRTTIKVTVLD